MWLNLLLTKWGLVILVAVVVLCVFVYRTVRQQQTRFRRAVQVRRRKGGDQILVLVDGRRGSPARAAHVAFRTAADPLRLTVAIAGKESVIDAYNRLQDTCVDYGGRLLTLAVDSKNPAERLRLLRNGFVRAYHIHVCVLSSRVERLRRGWDAVLCRLSAREPPGTALTSFPSASSSIVLYPVVGSSGRVRLKRIRRALSVSMPCVAVSPALCFVDAGQPWSSDAASLTDALASCGRLVLSPRTLVFASGQIRDVVAAPRGAVPSRGIVADEEDDPAGYAVELDTKLG